MKSHMISRNNGVFTHAHEHMLSIIEIIIITKRENDIRLRGQKLGKSV